jgi:hypothetical protein
MMMMTTTMVTMMKKILLTNAIRIANGEIPTVDVQKPHWTFIVADNQIIEWGRNLMDAHPPVHFGYSPHSKLHSEYVAFKRARGLLNGNEFDIINIRLNKRGEWRMSMPCSSCWNWLTAVGCNRAFFTTPNGWAKL